MALVRLSVAAFRFSHAWGQCSSAVTAASKQSVAFIRSFTVSRAGTRVFHTFSRFVAASCRDLAADGVSSAALGDK